MSGFNLVDRKWIPVSYTDGTSRTVSLRNMLHDADQIWSLSVGGPDHELPLLRLFGAILLRSHAGCDDPADCWKRQWADNRLDMEPIDAYLDHWHDRFDLYDPIRPFMQTPGLQVAMRPIAGLLLQSEQFGRRFPEHLSPADTAVELIRFQSFDSGGIKPAALHDQRANGGKLMPPAGLMGPATIGRFMAVWPTCRSLARTLLACTPPVDQNGNPTTNDHDLPAWERGILSEEELGGTVDGMADELTLQTRRILIDHDEEGNATGLAGTYGRVVTRDGLNCMEPHCMWDKAGQYPAATMTTQLGKPAWWNLSNIHYGKRKPLALKWTANLADASEPVTLHCMGSLYDQGAKQSQLDHRSITVPAITLTSANTALLVWRTRMAVQAYVRYASVIAVHWTLTDSERLTETTAADLDRFVTRLLRAPEDDSFDTIARLLKQMGNDLRERYPMSNPVPQFKFNATLVDLAKATPDFQNETEKPREAAARKRGRAARPITRHGGMLPDETFKSARQAVDWLHEHGKPTASTTNLYIAVSRKTTAYGYQWSNPE
ncbi:type I-E CRISPR-associated protein Cse1/CasA [Bifidobacterium biavatii]|uniref:CRISPR-associated protein, Cse1 family n=1 Tax=Bifidobacterium biavatii DSM 23969 TaxID=1437608 RepID=A0A086Z5X0_9BIFI|nr:type I-E CRISPR-associated protein Cse1/CasA [Bifidobacterium biavatii]KFI41920.1 CRISPR-associated protein, Cse1 family [Bifidobacterium biavatii DSM 23969]